MGINMSVTSVVVNDTKLFGPTGDVRRWAEKVAVRFTLYSKAEAPTGAATGRVNKTSSAFPVGSLRRNIFFEVTRVGPRQLVTTVSVAVPYAMYVLKGTNTIIARGEGGRFATAEEGMYIPANPGWGRSKFRQRVRGQRANPFLDRAYDRTARVHPALRGFKFTV